jgi:hypothetical protein
MELPPGEDTGDRQTATCCHFRDATLTGVPDSGEPRHAKQFLNSDADAPGSGAGRGRFVWLIVGCLFILSVLFRCGVADLSDWGIDEAANLWLGTQMLYGHEVPSGLVSSRGIPNLAGAPMIAAPLSLLPDLLTVSRVLSLAHLVALAILGFALWRRGGSAVETAAVLFLFPALLLASISMWNQYLTIPFTALALPLLLFLADGRPGPHSRGWALVAFVLLTFTQPAVHLASFVDLAVNLLLLILVLALRPRRVSAVVVVPGLILVGFAFLFLYRPWLNRISEQFGIHANWTATAIALVLVTISAVVILRDHRRTFDRLGSIALGSPYLGWVVLAALVFCVAASSVLPFRGAQAGNRLLRAGEISGGMLLVAQIGLVVATVPLLWSLLKDCRRGLASSDTIGRHFSCSSGSAVILVAYPILLCGVRLIVEPTLLSPSGRGDLLLPLLPAMLAPLLVLGRPGARRATSVIVRSAALLAVTAYIWLGTAGVSRTFVERFWQPVPPSEMREAVDWVAARHLEQGGGGVIDVGYDLEQGREWINEVACRPWTSWYSIGRPYDWLLKRRHGFDNIREGTCERAGGTGFQLGYRLLDETPADMVVVHTLEHLEIRVPAPKER